MIIKLDPLTQKTIELLGAGDRLFFTREPVTVRYHMADGTYRSRHVPYGFDTDLASVPRWARWVVSVASAQLPYVVHDYLYRYQPGTVTRAEADALMLALMNHCGAPSSAFRRRVAYLAVRSGGWKGWRKNRKSLPGKKETAPR